MTDPKIIPTSPVVPARGINIREAARYVGVSIGTYRKMVALGLAPAPLKLPGIGRHIFDRQAIDAAMSARAVTR